MTILGQLLPFLRLSEAIHVTFVVGVLTVIEFLCFALFCDKVQRDETPILAKFLFIFHHRDGAESSESMS